MKIRRIIIAAAVITSATAPYAKESMSDSLNESSQQIVPSAFVSTTGATTAVAPSNIDTAFRINLEKLENTDDRPTAEMPLAFRKESWNGKKIPSVENRSINASGINHEARLTDFSTDEEIATLSIDETTLPPIDKQIEEANLLGTFTGNEFFDWVKSPVPLEDQTTETSERTMVKTFSIGTDRYANSLFPLPTFNTELNYRITPPPPKWNERLRPKIFVPKWPEFWTTETDTAPVVVMMFRF